jgi:hypothetical protein
MKKGFKHYCLKPFSFRRGGQIRTDDLLLPKQARYRATLHPERMIDLVSRPKPIVLYESLR